jgi:hypothetical protein
VAGPYELDPGQTQYSIPTWAAPGFTRVKVTNRTQASGKISMTAGGSEKEYDLIPPGIVSTFDRSFAGVYLAVTNESEKGIHLTVETE